MRVGDYHNLRGSVCELTEDGVIGKEPQHEEGDGQSDESEEATHGTVAMTSKQVAARE